MGINSYQRDMYKTSLEHAERRNHKYLYKIGNRYIYPEDVANGAKSIASKGQTNNIEMRKARAESTAAGNQKLKTNLTNKEKLKKAGKVALMLTGPGRELAFEQTVANKMGKPAADEPIKKDNGELIKSANSGESFTSRMAKKAAKKVSDKASAVNKEGQANEINRRKERAESIAAGNEKMAKKIKKKKKKIMDVAKHSESLHHRYLSHALGQRRAHHKYLYIDANGRYVYPEDVPKGTTGIQQHHAQVLSDRRQAKKDKAYSKETKGINDRIDSQLGVSGASRMIRGAQQLTNAHQGSTEYRNLDSYAYRISDADKAKDITKNRKLAKAINNADSQRKSAHAGYEADKKAFPEGGSTEELEAQKKKTRMRKQLAASRAAENERKKSGFVEEGSTEELENQKRKTQARKTVARTEDTIERMRKKKKRPTTKGKKIETWDNSSNVKRWR